MVVEVVVVVVGTEVVVASRDVFGGELDLLLVITELVDVGCELDIDNSCVAGVAIVVEVLVAAGLVAEVLVV